MNCTKSARGTSVGAVLVGRACSALSCGAACSTWRGFSHSVTAVMVAATATRDTTANAQRRPVVESGRPDLYSSRGPRGPAAGVVNGSRPSQPPLHDPKRVRRQRRWARRVSNPRPLVCKTRALPLSYTPVPRAALHARARAGYPSRAGVMKSVQALTVARASVQSVWSRASPGALHSANRITPEWSMTKVPRLAMPASALNTP